MIFENMFGSVLRELLLACIVSASLSTRRLRMTIARTQLVDASLTRWYHCVTRCVRRAFLLGEGDQNRREWIDNRLEELADIFAVAVGGFSVIESHRFESGGRPGRDNSGNKRLYIDQATTGSRRGSRCDRPIGSGERRQRCRIACRGWFGRVVLALSDRGSPRFRLELKELGEDGSFEIFRERIIAEQLKRRYLKDILLILNQLDVHCTNTEEGNILGHLVELVLRRNVHVHNRGIVDERYIEPDKNRKSNYNPYGLKMCDPAPIDQAYCETANRLCGDCVSRVAAWAGG